MACLPVAVSGQEYTRLPAAPSALPAGQDHTLYLTLAVNGRPDDQVVPVRNSQGDYWVDAAILRRNHIRLAAEQQGDVNLSHLAQVKVSYDEPAQRLLLTVPDGWLPLQTIHNAGFIDRTAAQSQSGILFNYDIYTQSDSQQRYVSAWLEQRGFTPLGYLSNSGSWWQPLSSHHDGREQAYRRYDTYWRYSNENNMVSVQLGDIISNALTWSSAVRMGGIRISRDFSLRPDIVTWPLLQYSGTAAVPGSVDLFVNGYKASSNNVNAGPFAITNVPYINGAGEATVVTTDALGRQVSTSVPFYVANTLLRKGLSDFDFSAGALRRHYGVDNASYDSGAVSGIYRYGLFNMLTLSAHMETSNHLNLLGAGSDWAIGHWGTFSQSASQSSTRGQQGNQYSVGYSYYSPAFGLSAQHIQRDPRYRDLSVLDSDIALSKRSDQVTLSSAPWDGVAGSFGLGYFDIQANDHSRTQLVSLSWSHNLMWNSSLYLSANKTLGDSGFSTLLQWTLPLDFGNTATASVQRDANGDYSPRTTLSRMAPTQGGLGWNLAWGGGTSDYRQADIAWRSRVATLKTGVWQQSGQQTWWGDASGSVLMMDGAMFATNKINDSFLLVSTDGYRDVPVRYENQLIGLTDSSGHVLIPWATPWYPAKVEIATLDLAVDLDIPVVEQRVAVRAGSGALVKFPVSRVRSAALQLVDNTGAPLPPGTAVTELHSGQTAMVGYDGAVWLNHLPLDNTLRAQRGDGLACQVSFTLRDDASGYATLGKRPCLPPPSTTQEPSP